MKNEEKLERKNSLLGNQEVHYESEPYDDIEMNPYEIVMAVSKAARTINEKAQKYLGAENNIRPVNIALRKLFYDRVAYEYIEDGKQPEEETLSPAAKRNIPAEMKSDDAAGE